MGNIGQIWVKSFQYSALFTSFILSLNIYFAYGSNPQIWGKWIGKIKNLLPLMIIFGT